MHTHRDVTRQRPQRAQVCACAAVLRSLERRAVWRQRASHLLLRAVASCVSVAVCCSVLQCVAVCCSVLQCVAARERERQREIMWVCVYVYWCMCTRPNTWYSNFRLECICCSVLQCVAVRCSVLQRVTVCCSSWQFVAVCCSVSRMHLQEHRPIKETSSTSICLW